MEWTERIANYGRETGFPESLFIAGDGRVVGTWLLGNDYRVKSGYYGGYPAGYLKRIYSLFRDKDNILHLFAGKVNEDAGGITGDTVDIRPELNPNYLVDAHDLSAVPLENYDLILADPPYSEEDADHYGTPLVNRTTIMRELQATKPGTHIVWLDQAWPMYRKESFDLEAVIGLVRSTNHRVRMVFVYRRRFTTRRFIRL